MGRGQENKHLVLNGQGLLTKVPEGGFFIVAARCKDKGG
jgi:hypothetical protein